MNNFTTYHFNIQLDNLEKQKKQLKRRMKSTPKNNLYRFAYHLLLEDEKELEEEIEKERKRSCLLL